MIRFYFGMVVITSLVRSLRMPQGCHFPRLSARKFSAISPSGFEIEEKFRESAMQHTKAKKFGAFMKSIEVIRRNGEMSQHMTLIAFKALQRMNQTDLSVSLIPIWAEAVDREHNSTSSSPLSSAKSTLDLNIASTLLRGMCRLGRLDLAVQIAEKVNVIPSSPEQQLSREGEISVNDHKE